MKITKKQLQEIIREEISKLNEKIEDYRKGDTVHVKKINKSGVVLKQYGSKVHIKFVDGSEKTFNHDEIRKIQSDNVNESQKDIKLKPLLKESVDDSYIDEFHSYLLKKYKSKKVDGWELSMDRMTGTFNWDSGKHIIYATPFWEGEEALPIDVLDGSGDDVYQTKKPFKPSYDIKKDETTYFKLLRPIFKSIK